MSQERATGVLSAYDLSAGLFVRGLGNLQGMLKKAETHAADSGREDAALIASQLAVDMNDLGVQVHWATEGAKLATARLLGTAAAPAPAVDDGKRFAVLIQRIEATIAQLSVVSPEVLEAGLGRVIEIQHRGASKRYSGAQFLVEFAIPNFYFHVTTAYAILRHNGVPLTKGDFMGGWG